jgi:hypothetical protein
MSGSEGGSSERGRVTTRATGGAGPAAVVAGGCDGDGDGDGLVVLAARVPLPAVPLLLPPASCGDGDGGAAVPLLPLPVAPPAALALPAGAVVSPSAWRCAWRHASYSGVPRLRSQAASWLKMSACAAAAFMASCHERPWHSVGVMGRDHVTHNVPRSPA